MSMEPAPKTKDERLFQGRFEGPAEFAQLVRDALAEAARSGWRELILSDATFADWPLGEKAVMESLNAWARSGRELTMLAKHYDDVVRRHARFVQWRITWSHLVECRASGRADMLEVPSIVLGDGWVLHRMDPLRSVGVASTDAQRRTILVEELNEWLQRRSAPAFAASTLGL